MQLQAGKLGHELEFLDEDRFVIQLLASDGRFLDMLIKDGNEFRLRPDAMDELETPSQEWNSSAAVTSSSSAAAFSSSSAVPSCIKSAPPTRGVVVQGKGNRFTDIGAEWKDGTLVQVCCCVFRCILIFICAVAVCRILTAHPYCRISTLNIRRTVFHPKMWMQTTASKPW